MSKMDFLRILFSSHSLQILAITESWLREEVPDPLVDINNCILFRDDRSDGRVGGGVAVWANNSLQPTRVVIQGESYGTNSVWLIFHSLKLCFVCIYIPPSSVIQSSSDVLSFITLNLDNILSDFPDYDVIITGDFNRLNVSYLLSAFDLQNVVCVPTRGDAILDLVLLSSSLQNQYETTVGPPVSTSDHKTVLCFPNNEIIPSDDKVFSVYDLRDSNVDAFISLLSTIGFQGVYDPNISTEEKCTIFVETMKYCFSKKIPVSKVTLSSRDKPYVSPLIKSLINQRWSAYRCHNFPLYHHLSAKVKRLIFAEKVRWARKARRCPKDMWNVVNEVRGTKSSRQSAINCIINQFRSPLEAAQEINAKFASTQSQRPTAPFTDDLQDWSPTVSSDSVFQSLSKLKPHKAPGIDGIPTVLYKKAAQVLTNPLTHIINVSIEERKFPSVWKRGLITPVPKACPPTIEDLRPITLLPVPSKICEKLALTSELLSNFRLGFGKSQFGGIKNSSTAAALVCLHECITAALDSNETIGVIVLAYDFSKAFDSLGHDVILEALSTNGFPTGFILWIRDYLTDRRQAVKVNEHVSCERNVVSGIPQGSVLGPYLFNIVVGSLTPVLPTTTIVKYVDDCTFVIPVRQDSLRSYDLEHNNMVIWSHSVGLTLNLRKTKLLWIPKSPLCPPPSLPNVSSVENLTILGVSLSNDLKWHTHLDKVSKVTSRRLYAIRTLRPFLPRNDLVCVYRGLLLSVMEYCSPLLIGMSTKNKQTLDKLQRRAHNIICGFDCSCDLFEDLTLRRKTAALKLLTVSASNKHHPLHSWCPKTSSHGNFIQPFSKTTRRRNSFFPTTVILANKTQID